MIVTLKDILAEADKGNYAVGAFNATSMAYARAVIAAAEELNAPIILMHAQVHEEMGLCKMDEVAPMMRFYAEKAKVPVCMHLDHGTDIDYVKRGLERGFGSVMYDGSNYSEEDNFKNTAYVKELAMKFGAHVEGEIGSMGARESGASGGQDESIYTDPEDAKRFVEETGIDALACAFGTAHGLYLKAPKLDFARLEKIRSMVSVPLVMHGGSGVSPEDYKKVIERGVRKINYYSYMAKAGATAVKAMKEMTFYHEIEVAAIEGMKEDVKTAIELFR